MVIRFSANGIREVSDREEDLATQHNFCARRCTESWSDSAPSGLPVDQKNNLKTRKSMPQKLVVEFTKMNGAGNDFIVIDDRFFNFSEEELSKLAQRYCPRRFGIGADGVLAFARPEDPAHDYRMRYVNADGSVGTMCGNGARCLARFAQIAGFEQEEMIFETEAGVFQANVPLDLHSPIRLLVNPPRDWMPERPLATGHTHGPVHYIWTGTEHVVHFVDNLDDTPVDEWGSAIRRDRALVPHGANVNFVQVVDPGSESQPALLLARTYEKGVEAETLACGTGAMASSIAAFLLGEIERSTVEVQMRGGVLGVGFKNEGDTISDVYLEGPAEVVFRGSIEL